MSDTLESRVQAFFRMRGAASTRAFFLGSGVPMGWRVTNDGFEIVYRVDGEQLIICEFRATVGGRTEGHAVHRLVMQARALLSNVRGLRAVRGMIQPCRGQPALHERRLRMATYFIAQGARWEMLDGDRWLVFDDKRSSVKR